VDDAEESCAGVGCASLATGTARGSEELGGGADVTDEDARIDPMCRYARTAPSEASPSSAAAPQIARNAHGARAGIDADGSACSSRVA